jgi:hypothetical protein
MMEVKPGVLYYSVIKIDGTLLKQGVVTSSREQGTDIPGLPKGLFVLKMTSNHRSSLQKILLH